MIGKILGLLGLWVETMDIISSLPFSLGFLKSFNGTCKALFMLFSIKAIGCFCFLNNVFSCDNHFSFVSSSTIAQMHLVKQNGIFLRQLRRWFDVNSTYLFESVGSLYISIQIFVPVLFIIISKNGKFVLLLSIVNCKLGFTWFKIFSKSLGLINLVFRRISQSSKNQNQFSSKNLLTTKLYF